MTATSEEYLDCLKIPVITIGNQISSRFPLEELGEKTVNCLVGQIQGNRNAEDIYLSHRIIKGNSL